MGRFQGGPQAALLVAGVAMALGGSALFGLIAHTKTPFFEKAGTAPPDSPPKNPAIQMAKSGWPTPATPATPKPPESPSPPDTVPAESLTPRESVVVVLGPAESHPSEPFEANFPVPAPVETRLAEAPQPAVKIEEAKPIEPKGPDLRTAELNVMAGPKWARPKPAVVEAKAAVEVPQAAMTSTAIAKPIEPKVVEAIRVKPKPVEVKVAAAKPVEPKAIEASRAKPKPTEKLRALMSRDDD